MWNLYQVSFPQYFGEWWPGGWRNKVGGWNPVDLHEIWSIPCPTHSQPWGLRTRHFLWRSISWQLTRVNSEKLWFDSGKCYVADIQYWQLKLHSRSAGVEMVLMESKNSLVTCEMIRQHSHSTGVLFSHSPWGCKRLWYVSVTGWSGGKMDVPCKQRARQPYAVKRSTPAERNITQNTLNLDS